MTFIQTQYNGFDCFTFKGRKFLVLLAKSNDVHVYNEKLENYGCYQSVDSFRKMYGQQMEALNLDQASFAIR